MMKKDYKDFCVKEDISLIDAMTKMNTTGHRTLFIVDEAMRLKGALSAGDLRRWILSSGGVLNTDVSRIYNRKAVSLPKDFDPETVRDMMLSNEITIIPIVDDGLVIVDILLWTEIFGGQRQFNRIGDKVSVVIMAGGVGSRMKPFTKILPKPLLPIGEKPVVQVIMDRFHAFGLDDFHMIVNFKKGMIMSYFENTELPYSVNFVDEGALLGTCGGLTKLPFENLSENFILTNCDSLIDADFSEIYQFHKEHGNDVTLISTARKFTIPYGVIELSQETRQIKEIVEKPSFTYLVNTGSYILNKRTIRLIPPGQPFGTPSLIKEVIRTGGRASLFPIEPNARLDTGEWDEYKKTLDVFGSKENPFSMAENA